MSGQQGFALPVADAVLTGPPDAERRAKAIGVICRWLATAANRHGCDGEGCAKPGHRADTAALATVLEALGLAGGESAGHLNDWGKRRQDKHKGKR